MSRATLHRSHRTRCNLERLESRWCPTTAAPGTYSGTISSNTEFDQAGNYFISGTLTVNPGVTLKVGTTPGVNLIINNDATLVITTGAQVTVDTLSSLTFQGSNSFASPAQGIQINGLLTATNTLFAAPAFSDVSYIQMGPSGRLVSTNCTYQLDQMTWDNVSLMSSGNITGNAFDNPIQLPGSFIPLLANNQRFADVIITGGSPLGTTLDLNPLGTVTTANQRYVFAAGNHAVTGGSKLNINAGSNVMIGDNATITVNLGGSMTVSNPASMVIQGSNSFASPAQGIQINGLLTATNTLFAAPAFSDISYIQMGPSGRLVSTDCTYQLDQMTWDNTSLMSSGNITGNAFDNPIQMPGSFIPLLANNQRFADVIITGGSPLGTTLDLNPLGTVTTANQRYVFAAGNHAINSGSKVNILPGSTVLIGNDATISVNSGGALNVVNPAGFVIDGSNAFASPAQAVVVNGLMSCIGTVFSQPNFSDSTLLQVNNGGRLRIGGGSFGWDLLQVNAGAVVDMQFMTLTSRMDLHSQATLNITKNGFAGLSGNAIAAFGPNTSTISLAGNFWGTTDPMTIASHVLDKADDGTRPTVLTDGPLMQRPVGVTGVVVNNLSAQRSRVADVTVYFSDIVTLPATAIRFERVSGGPPATLVSGTPTPSQGRVLVTPGVGGNATTAQLAFATNSGSTAAVGEGVEFGSLANGVWRLTVLAAGIQNGSGTFMTGNYTTPTTGTATDGRIHRLFGDADGDATVTANDFLAFRLAFLGSSPTFDANGDGQVGSDDFLAFRLNFLLSV